MLDASFVAGIMPGEEYRDVVRRDARLPANVVRTLCEINPVKSLLALVHTVGVIALAVWVALTWWSVWTVAPAIIVIASRQLALFVLAHDAAHYRMFSNRSLNDFMGRGCGAVVGISMLTYRVVHRLHHNHLYQESDPDIPLHAGYPRGRVYLVRKLLGDLTGKTAWKTYRYFFGAPGINDDLREKNRPLMDTSVKLRHGASYDRWVVVGVHVGMMGLAVGAGHAVEYALLWLLPALTLLQALLRYRAICEHGAVENLSSPLTSARTNLGHPVLLWYLFPHHVNYHIEHHMYPGVPHYNLPACHRALVGQGLLDGGEVRRFRETVSLIFGTK